MHARCARAEENVSRIAKKATTGWLVEIDETRKDVTAGRTAHVLNVQYLAHVLLIGDQL